MSQIAADPVHWAKGFACVPLVERRQTAHGWSAT